MTNEEKINEIGNSKPTNWISNEDLCTYQQGLRRGAFEMAEWKDQQFAEEKKQWIEKAHDWLIKNSSKYVGFDENQFLAYAYKTMSDDFIKYMEE